MPPYAVKTTVLVATTRADIETLLRRATARRLITMDEPGEALVAFELASRGFRISVPIPADASDQRRRSIWRALLLVIKGKLEAVAQGVVSVEREFLAYVVLPDGSTLYEHAAKAVALAYSTGELPKLLPPANSR